MGEWMVRKSIKFPGWMLERLNRERERFEPYCENESDVIRLLLRIVFRVIDAGMLEQMTRGLQGIQCHTVCAHCGTASSLETRPEMAAGAESLKEGDRPGSLRRLNRLESRRYRRAVGSVGMALSASFLGNVRPSFARG